MSCCLKKGRALSTCSIVRKTPPSGPTVALCFTCTCSTRIDYTACRCMQRILHNSNRLFIDTNFKNKHIKISVQRYKCKPAIAPSSKAPLKVEHRTILIHEILLYSLTHRHRNFIRYNLPAAPCLPAAFELFSIQNASIESSQLDPISNTSKRNQKHLF